MKKLSVKPEFTLKMFEILGGVWIAGCVKTAAELNIADYLAEGKQTISSLAEQTESDEKSLYRIMRALSGVGIFEELENKTFALNDFGAALQTDVEGTAKNFVLTILGEHFPAYMELTYNAKTGKIPFEHVHGVGVWEYYKRNPEAGVNFGKGMTGMSGMELEGIMSTYDFSPIKQLWI